MKTTKHAVPKLMLAALVLTSVACSPAEETPAAETPTTAAAAPTTAAPTAEGGASPSTSAGAEAAPAEEAVITIVDFEYEVPETIAPGAEVTVINEDDAPHTVTADGDGDFDVEVAGGETVTFTAPEEAGEYSIICTYHPEMLGTMIVG